MNQNEYYTVVVADDEDELREAVCSLIPWEEIGLQLVGSAGNGLDALELVEQLQPDLLLTDIRMPFISGVELARQVWELRPWTHIVFLSGYDDFAYAQKAIEYQVVSYLLKPIAMAELTEALREVCRKIDARYQALRSPAARVEEGRLAFVAPLLLDSFTGEEELDEQALRAQAAQAGLLRGDQGEEVMTVAAVSLCRDGRPSCPEGVAAACDLVLQCHCRSCSVVTGGGRIFILLVGAEPEQWLPSALDELSQAISRVWRLQCTHGISRPVTEWRKIRSACREAMEALGAAERGCLVTLPQPTAEATMPDLTALAAKAESMLRSASRAELEAWLTEAVGSEAGLLQILAALQRVLTASVTPEEGRELWRRSRLPWPILPGGLERRVQQACLLSRDLLAEGRRDGVSHLCRQTLDLIDRQYMDEDLSLGAVSQQLHVSPGYLSASMKKHAGDTFMNLLIKKRMEVAGELLRTTNLKILEVARRCGYSDQHYFSYCFKKYYGLSPVQLRREGRGEKP